MPTVYLVDGTFELFRCFHGAPRALGADGVEVGAGRALLATMTKLLATRDVTHIAVAFDSVVAPVPPKGPPGAEALIGAQQPLAADVIRALGVPVWPAGRFQADDVLASAAARLAEDPGVDQVVICTNDNDLAQCVRGERVVLFDRIRDRLMDEAAVVARFGVRPPQIPDLFGLIGDRSDGVAGVPGWGPASAAAVLGRFATLTEIPADPAAWPPSVRGRDRLAANLRARRDEALLSREFSVRRDDLPVPATLAGVAWHGAHRERIEALTTRLGDDSTVARIPRWRDPTPQGP